MPTVINKNIWASGGDYTTVQAYEDALPASLVTADEQWNGFVREEVVMATFGTPVVNFSAHTADATRYWTLQNESGYGVTPSSSNPARYDGSKGAALKQTGGGGAGHGITFSGQNNFHRLIGIQVWTAGSGIPLNFGDENDFLHENCIFETTSTGGVVNYISNTGGTSRKCYYIADFDSADIAAIGTSGSDALLFYFCSFVRPSNRTAGGNAIFVRGGSVSPHIIKDCFFGGVAAGSLNDWTNVTASNNGSTATIGGGSSNQPSLTYADQVENPSSASGTHDFRMKSGATLDGNGVAISGITTDFFGTTYDDPPAIGPMELAAAAVTLDQKRFRYRNDDGSETTATWAGAEGADLTRAKETPARLRVQVKEAGGADPAAKRFELQVQAPGDCWRTVR